MNQALNQKIDAYIAENKEQLLQDIAALVAIDSVEGTPEEGAPFGACAFRTAGCWAAASRTIRAR